MSLGVAGDFRRDYIDLDEGTGDKILFISAGLGDFSLFSKGLGEITLFVSKLGLGEIFLGLGDTDVLCVMGLGDALALNFLILGT